MRALSLPGPRQAVVVDVIEPTAGPGQVLLRITACGVCGSDLNAWRGVPGIEYPLTPGAPGHEAIGDVVALGPDVVEPRIGQTVTGLLWNGFAELAVARASDVLPVPSGMGEILGEPLACAMNVVRRANIQPGDQVALVGFGYLAALIVHLLPTSCAWVAIASRAASRELALRLGAAAAYDFTCVPSDAWDHFPVVIEAAGVQQTLDYATWLTAYGGRLVVAGYHADGPRTVNMQSWNWKGIEVTNAHERKPAVYVGALRAAFDALRARPVDLPALHTHHWSFDQVTDAFRAADERPPEFVKSVIHP